MIFETNKDKGRAGMSMGIAYFGSNGYTVSIPLNDTQWYDFIAEKDGKFYTVQCKATGSANNVISLKSSGGTKGTTYDNVIDHDVDYLFCLDKEQNMFVIPVEDIKANGNVKQITLKTEVSKFANSTTLQTAQYLVKF
jgi:hypothetical protein